ncbi:syntaxin-6-like isoform X2 [Gouania willdenowi]|uniref:syntaxin-6-like isoform X2 n=1 Tax=Gouania willdenowi TaxID=441366 RepID=UPI00105581B1|nr:syntaxin-6-like isoform X2 [Gouania willdenowi]
MSMEDPFFVVKGEVFKAVLVAQNLRRRLDQLQDEGGGASKEEVDWTTNELRNSLRSIQWDLEDLEETIRIVELNPQKFNLEPAELMKRRAFITSTRNTVQVMKEQMCGPVSSTDSINTQAPIWRSSDERNRLDHHHHHLHKANTEFIEEQQSQQQLIVDQQDEQLELVSGTIGVLKNMSERIGLELDDQAEILDDFGQQMDNTQSRLDNVMKKLAKVSHMTSGSSGF